MLHKQISSNFMLKDVRDSMCSTNFQSTITAANWTTLEILSALSVLIASHENWFKGMNAELWLRHFFKRNK